jgi:chitin disaccharide deacetylase
LIERALIVNADDFGLSVRTNAGIVRAHERGIVTSASLMVRAVASAEAASYARTRPQLSIGLHMDLGEWVYTNGTWVMRYEHGPAEEEIPRQLDRFRTLIGGDPTHLDSHQHVHRTEPAATLMSRLSDQLGVCLRGRGNVEYCGDYYGQTGTGEPLPEAITTAALVRLVERTPPGTSELACHPGLDLDLESPYRMERAREVEALCDPVVRTALQREGVRLLSFAAMRSTC